MKTTRLQFVQGAMGVCVAGVLTAACGDDKMERPDGAGGDGPDGAAGDGPDGAAGDGPDGAAGDGTGEPPDGTGGGGGSGLSCSSAIAANHGHRLTVTSADLAAGVAKTYDIQGSATHSHTVELSADDFADLLDGTALTVTSSTGASHTHEVTIDCT